MIKNPKVGQKIFLIREKEIHESSIKYVDGIYIVTDDPDCLVIRIDKIFSTEKLACEEVLKTLNKEIAKLSKQREKLATRLAKILGAKQTTTTKLPKTWGTVNGRKF